MAQAIQQTTTIPAPRRKPVSPPAVIPIEFGWSKEKWVFSCLPGSDTMIVMLHHDAAELERVVAGLVAFQENARAWLFKCSTADVWTGNCR